jgi:hypothetical protein
MWTSIELWGRDVKFSEIFNHGGKVEGDWEEL